MGRQKYYVRRRFIYALFFENNAVYIGQSVDPKRREAEHKRPSGEWCGAPFRMRVLYEFQGTHSDGEHFERSYRLRAKRRGLAVYGLPHVFINPENQATIYQRVASYRVPWPRQEGRSPYLRWAVLFVSALLFFAYLAT